MATFWELLLNFFFPMQCAVCRRLIEANNKKHVCKHCWEQIVYLTRPIDIKLSMERVWSVGVYDGVLRELIHQFKYMRKRFLAFPLGRLMVEFGKKYMAEEEFDCIIPVPLEKSREKRRGYNQAELLAHVFGEGFSKPVLARAIERRKKTRPQVGLNREERFRNVSGAFCVSKEVKRGEISLSGKRILLVDDLTTTGATLDECALILKKAGARSVVGLVLAHGL